MMSIYLYTFISLALSHSISVPCIQLSHAHTDILALPVIQSECECSFVHLNVICSAQRGKRIDVNLQQLEKCYVYIYICMFQIAVNSNKHAIYINFLCHIFIHFGRFFGEYVSISISQCRMSDAENINMQWYCFNRNCESSEWKTEKSPFASN